MPNPPQLPDRTRKPIGPVPVETVEKMWQLYVREEPVRHIARECGVSVETVRKYIEKGDPSRRLKSLRQRKIDNILRVQQISDESTTHRIAAHLDAVGGLMFRSLRNTNKALDDPDPDKRYTPSVAETCMVLREHASAVSLVQRAGGSMPSPLVHIDMRGRDVPGGVSPGGMASTPPSAQVGALRALAGMSAEEGNALVSNVRRVIQAAEEEELRQSAPVTVLPAGASR